MKIISYAPAIFKTIQKLDGVSHTQIETSLNPDVNQKQVFKAKESAGKSGSFFFFSQDRKFLIKTMNNDELRVFRDLLPNYT